MPFPLKHIVKVCLVTTNTSQSWSTEPTGWVPGTASGKYIARRVPAGLTRSQGPAEEWRSGCYSSSHFASITLHGCPHSSPGPGSLLPALGLLINQMESLIGELCAKVFLGTSSSSMPKSLSSPISSNKSNPATHSSILAWKIPWMEDLTGYSPGGHRESDVTEWLTHTFLLFWCVSFTGHPTYLDEVSVIPTILLTRTLRLRKIKEKVAPSHTVAEQEGYPRSVWFQYLHFISWRVTELLIQRQLEVKGGQRGSPTRKNLFPGPLSGHHHTEEECPGASVQSRKTLSFSLRQFLEAREDPCSFFFYHLVHLCSRCYTGWIGLTTFQNLLECHSFGSMWELLRNAGSQVPT